MNTSPLALIISMKLIMMGELMILAPAFQQYVCMKQSLDTSILTSSLLQDRKWADVFRLNNRTAFNVKGELKVITLETGKEITLSAIQANSTVDLETDYHFLDHEFTHRTRLGLAPTVWVSYYLDIINKTTVNRIETIKFNILIKIGRSIKKKETFGWILHIPGKISQ